MKNNEGMWSFNHIESDSRQENFEVIHFHVYYINQPYIYFMSTIYLEV